MLDTEAKNIKHAILAEVGSGSVVIVTKVVSVLSAIILLSVCLPWDCFVQLVCYMIQFAQ